METTKKETVIKNMLWRFVERSGAQGVSFVVSIILARLLDPEVYGTIALVTVFTTLLNVFIDSGLGNALIQKKDADDTDFSSVFYFNLTVCALLYIGVFFAAPLIARFYDRMELVPIIRVLSLSLLISGVKNIQQAYVSKHLLFRKFFFSTLGGTIGAAIVGIYMAWAGYGVWALIVQSLFNMLVDTIILWITVKWRPKLLFSWKSLKQLLRFGWKLLVSRLLNAVFNDVRSLIIGKKYTSADLAFFKKGDHFPSLVIQNVNTAMDSVLLPVLAKEQNDKLRLKNMTKRAIKTSSYVIVPMMVGLAVCSEPLIKTLLTDKWLPCVPFLRIYCFTYSLYPINIANSNAILALGRSDVSLRISVIKKIIDFTALIISMWFGVMAMAYSLLITAILGQMLNAFPNKRILGYGYGEQIMDMLPQILLATGMGAIVYSVSLLPLPAFLVLLIQVPLGVLLYYLGSKLFHIEAADYVLRSVRQMLKKK